MYKKASQATDTNTYVEARPHVFGSTAVHSVHIVQVAQNDVCAVEGAIQHGDVIIAIEDVVHSRLACLRHRADLPVLEGLHWAVERIRCNGRSQQHPCALSAHLESYLTTTPVSRTALWRATPDGWACAVAIGSMRSARAGFAS